MTSNKVLLSTTYFGPVQWYQKLYRAEHVTIEQWESFQKQTYRNRCLMGVQALTVPVEKPANSGNCIKDLRISDHGNWRHLHWNALQSAYGESPFFEYYQDDIRPFFERRWTFLLDFNEAIRQQICDLIDFEPKLSYSTEYVVDSKTLAVDDLRATINPKHPAQDDEFEAKPYYQVYQTKHGFLRNLSVIDLLFNMGPESIFYL